MNVSDESPDVPAETPSRMSRKPHLVLNTSQLPNPKHENSYLTDSGTFTADDMIINSEGLRVLGEPARPVSPVPMRAPDSDQLLSVGVRPRSASSTSFDARTQPQPQRPAAPVAENDQMWEVTSLDDLKSVGFIGRGACGLVKKVLHVPSNRVLAIKIIPLDVDEKVRKQVLLELRALYRTVCPYIVPYHGAFYRDGAFYIVLQFMDGGSLTDLIHKMRGRNMPEQVIGRFAKMCLRGLVYMNKEHHLLHRDIKPSNLLLNRKGQIMISDLGLVGQLANSMENAQSFVGTVLYMSPERIQGKEYSYACDVWSLGLTFYECALGRYPFEPTAGRNKLEFFDVFHCIVQQQPPQLPRDRFSAEFCDFIELCMMKEPEQRPTAAKLLDHPFMESIDLDDLSFDMAAWICEQLDRVE